MSQLSRTTKQRTTILEELRKVSTHPTADEIYNMVREKLPRISLGTVYRNLEYLAEAKEILKLENAGSQKRFDGTPHPHQHIRCERCGKVSDVRPEIPIPQVDDVLKSKLAEQGFQLRGTSLELYGICADCSNI